MSLHVPVWFRQLPYSTLKDILLEYVTRSILVSCASRAARSLRSEEHTSELHSLMRISYAVYCLKKKNTIEYQIDNEPNSTQQFQHILHQNMILSNIQSITHTLYT